MMQIRADPAIIINSPSNALGIEVKMVWYKDGLIDEDFWDLGQMEGVRGQCAGEQEPISSPEIVPAQDSTSSDAFLSRLDDILLWPVTVKPFLIQYPGSVVPLTMF